MRAKRTKTIKILKAVRAKTQQTIKILKAVREKNATNN